MKEKTKDIFSKLGVEREEGIKTVFRESYKFLLEITKHKIDSLFQEFFSTDSFAQR